MDAVREDVLGKVETGDLVLFSGSGLRSKLIKRITKCEWSHIGMVVRLEDHSWPLLYESTSVGALPDVRLDRVTNGVQLVPLKQRVELYPGKVAIRRLSHSPCDVKLDKLYELKKQVVGRPYEKDDLQLIKSAYDGPLGKNLCDTSSLFCSELVALAYMEMGLLDRSSPANEYTPADFSSMINVELQGASLSDEVVVKL